MWLSCQAQGIHFTAPVSVLVSATASCCMLLVWTEDSHSYIRMTLSGKVSMSLLV